MLIYSDVYKFRINLFATILDKITVMIVSFSLLMESNVDNINKIDSIHAITQVD